MLRRHILVWSFIELEKCRIWNPRQLFNGPLLLTHRRARVPRMFYDLVNEQQCCEICVCVSVCLCLQHVRALECLCEYVLCMCESECLFEKSEGVCALLCLRQIICGMYVKSKSVCVCVCNRDLFPPTPPLLSVRWLHHSPETNPANSAADSQRFFLHTHTHTLVKTSH